MTAYRRGDLVLVNLAFADGSGAKRRPVLVLSSEAYHRGRQEAIVAGVTSNTERILPGDQVISDWKGAGLLWPSVVTGILRTVKRAMVQRKLGTLPVADMQKYEESLREALGLV